MLWKVILPSIHDAQKDLNSSGRAIWVASLIQIVIENIWAWLSGYSGLLRAARHISCLCCVLSTNQVTANLPMYSNSNTQKAYFCRRWIQQRGKIATVVILSHVDLFTQFYCDDRLLPILLCRWGSRWTTSIEFNVLYRNRQKSSIQINQYKITQRPPTPKEDWRFGYLALLISRIL